MRRVALLAFPLLLAVTGCGDDYQPEQLYLATTPDCREWVDGSTFRLPEGVSVSATTPVTVKEGSAEFGVVYLVPRGGRVQFVTRAFNITQPKGATIAKAKVLSYYQRGTNNRAEMVEVITNIPALLLPVATAEVTQWRIRLGVDQKLPARFDLVLSDVIIDDERHPVRTFTYRWFPERKAYGLCR
ncbi:hypothetical protein [Pseudoduganella lutea]|uniref:Lipoprotein n=1 Tax=Pseudoduganella lutea TaxID=321985 RepID=A0A4P6KYS1_9BURK|nr:hypothetical protein [Pseudoduganella lutea]QBE63732.1 hypothetical protein EWM63_12720 [Pseudoduganella lutea]